MEENANQNVREEGGVTLGAICRVIFQWKRLLAILAATIVAAVATFVVFKLSIEPQNTSYTAQFNFEMVQTASSAEYFTSGQFFIDEDTLSSVKNSDERFSGVDVKNMLSDGKYPVTVKQEFTKTEDDIIESYYTFSVSEKVFSNKRVAKEFVRAVVESVKSRAVEDAKALAAKDETGFNGYQAQLRGYQDASTYEEKLSILLAQRNYLIDLYNRWIDEYGNLYQAQSVNKSLMDLREMVQLSFSDTQYDELTAELRANAYVPSSEDSTILQSRLNTYREQLDLNERKLANLNEELSKLVEQYKNVDGTASSLMPQFGEFHSRIAALTEENADIQKKIDTIEKLLGNETTKQDYVERENKFEASLQKIYDGLTAQSQDIASVAEEIAGRESYATIESIESSGGANTVLVTLVVAVLVFVIASAVCYVIVSRRGKRAAQPQEGAQDKGSEEAPRE